MVAICDILVVGIPATEWARFLVIQPRCSVPDTLNLYIACWIYVHVDVKNPHIHSCYDFSYSMFCSIQIESESILCRKASQPVNDNYCGSQVFMDHLTLLAHISNIVYRLAFSCTLIFISL